MLDQPSRKRVYSTECMMSRLPPYRTEEPLFFHCPSCGMVQVRLRPFGAPSSAPGDAGSCCGQTLEQLGICDDAELASEHQMDFCVFGGPAHNSIRIEVVEGVHPMEEEHCIEWIFLRTFQGGQMKYLPPKKASAAIFSMAEEDAFMFCGREVCRMGWEHCAFQCKRGHIAYAYCSRHGLFALRF